MLFPVQSPILVASNLLLIGLIFLFLYPTFSKDNIPPRWQVYAAITCVIIFSMFSFWGTDWFHYQEDFQKIKTYTNIRTHIEPVYIFIIKQLCPHYFVFRAIVWGSGLLLMALSLHRLQLNSPLAWFFFGTLFLPLYAYARVSLAIAMIVYGAVLIDKPFESKKYLSYALGVAIIVCSFFFHKSAIIGIVVLAFSFIVKDPKSNSWLIYAFGFLACLFISKIVIEVFLGTSIQVDDEFAKSGQSYLGRSHAAVKRGIGALIYMFLERIPYYLTALLSYKILKEYQVARGVHILLKFQLFITLFASLFFFDTGANTSIFFGRVLRFMLIPASIILCYAHQYRLYPKLVLSSFAIGLAHTVYAISYSLYISTT